jgi:signal peptidase I
MRKWASLSVMVAALAVVGSVSSAGATPAPFATTPGTEVFYIPSPSMYPTLKPGDYVLVNTRAYVSSPVRVGDIVVFRRPPKDDSPGIADLIKRVLAIGGETIYVANCNIYINGKIELQPYLPKGYQNPDSPYCTTWAAPGMLNLPDPYTVPAGQCFVMGDNRKDSLDSRYWGPLPDSYIIGKAVDVAAWTPLRG